MPTGLIASASRLTLDASVSPQASLPPQQAWQKDAWAYFDTIGELRFVTTWVGNVMSRAKLRVVEQTPDGPVVQTDGPAVEALDAYFDGPQGQEQMLRTTGTVLAVPGECFHAYIKARNAWYVLERDEIRKRNGLYAHVDGEWVPIGSNGLALRVWQPHPARMHEADSPIRSNLATLAEIHRATQHIEATLTSRLAGAGVLFVPNEITFPIPEGVDPSSSPADVFMATLAEAMTTPIADRGNASAIVPVTALVPGENISQIKHVTFWSELSDTIVPLRQDAVRRLALGMDVPPEVLTGMADTNHWSAWLIDESSIKAHIDPPLAVVANAITTGYLRPALKGVEADPSVFAVAADTVAIRLRPNRSREAIELWDRGELSGTALRRETGFDATDAPEPLDFKEWLLRRIALASAVDPATVASAIKTLGVDIAMPADVVPIDRARHSRDTKRTLDEHPSRDIPQVASAAFAEGLVVACHALVVRALERAGHKITNKTQQIGNDPTIAYLTVDHTIPTTTLLEGAWSTADAVLAPFFNDTDSVVKLLNAYTADLINNRRAHDPAVLGLIVDTITKVG